MIKPLHSSDHVVSPEGTVELRGLKPGHRVHVLLFDQGEDKQVVDPAKYRRDDFNYERPDDPACDPDDWDALR